MFKRVLIRGFGKDGSIILLSHFQLDVYEYIDQYSISCLLFNIVYITFVHLCLGDADDMCVNVVFK